ncbi:MAG: acetyl-CoA carboxylase, biotin carboxyl carrier protein [Nitrospirae bacterium CG_4_9_14_3_um_filter_53_35]|nr:MAG: acetyl-CoA carboxylase, biotin carboxyl carrier protein [Nitrospirae bacterium CG2_30_53_67]PIS38077.1 MAG: acetyl-CoA carboxylase, biotin carboxyl carrier protein [Nitrospirae bacterium CG08_land_8_20_14_0_20_52_24]PIW84455.1 MAG: acetyl-CoA carboxylase, biotin carboxyl carrier protein [Nitrospirae bacterium CG_4_8_14_3_um_filter_50_41]PIX87007.1 MAG: acetyl-CoA carboxylase, biotin carboxyl carrier protein [Nitrospirae bacterium CG_4_10_14_3_um_filter_53_41]PJA74809.1 MAG: acetyl-CoA c
MNLKEIKELIEMVQGTGISEIELEREGFRVRIILGEAHRVHSVKEPAPSKSSPRTGEEDAEKPPASAETSVPEMVPGQIVVKSPMVGTFYRCPAPDSPPFVEVGSAVEKGQPLCIIEAMKLMNEIEADVKGSVLRILKEDKSPVEYGEPLFILEPLP